MNAEVINKVTLSDVKKRALEHFTNALQPEMSKCYPLFSFTYASVQHAFSLCSGLQHRFTKAGWLNGGIDELVLRPYFLLERICQEIPEEVVLLKYPDKVQDVWIQRDDRFLPPKWPKQTDSGLYSMLQAAAIFAIDTYAKASRAFEGIGSMSSVVVRPHPSKALLDCLERLAGIVPYYYKDTDFDSLLTDVHREIEYEYGLYARKQRQIAAVGSKSREDEQTTPEAKPDSTRVQNINIRNSHVILGNVRAENMQTGDDASIHKNSDTEKKKKGIFRRLWWIIAGVVAFLGSVLGVLDKLGWLEPVKSFIRDLFTHG